MTLGMVKNVTGELMFYDGNGIEVINKNTCGHYHKGRMTF